MIAVKFGGTSLQDGARIASAAAIVRGRSARQPLVVASAMAGVTNALLAAAEDAVAGHEQEAIARVAVEEARHDRAVDVLGVRGRRVEGLPPLTPAADAYLAQCFAEIRERMRGVALLGELTARSRDAIASAGELCASALLAAALPGVFVDARDVVKTDAAFGGAKPRSRLIEALAAERLRPHLEAGRIPVTQGFIGSTDAGATTTLGRGGSDYSAALLGAALRAEEIEIWTDVDGMLTADPRIVPAARLLPEITFDEAAELAYFGARVLHPATIRPALKRGIPVRVLNTFRPDGTGTLIRGGSASGAGASPAVRAIAARSGISVVLVTNPRMLRARGYGARVFEAFDRHGIAIGLISTSEVSISLTVEETDRIEAVAAELRSIADVAVHGDQAIVALVGRGLRGRSELPGKVFTALQGLSLALISMGASDRSLSFVVREDEVPDAMRKLHAAFLE